MAVLEIQADKVSPRPAKCQAEELRECILLIEDSEEVMRLVQSALREHGRGGYRLEWTNSMAAGLAQLSTGRVDLVLLDLGLPDCSGPLGYLWVRQVARDVPVVVFTGDTSEESDFALTAAGIADYLIKDQTSAALLIQAIRIALYARNEGIFHLGRSGRLTRRLLAALP